MIDPPKAANAFRSQREALKLVLQHDLPSVADKLYSKHIISAATLAEAMNQFHIASVRTVSLLSVVEDKIRAEPHVFTEFVKILESEPTLRSQAKELVTKYLKEGTAIYLFEYCMHLCDIYFKCRGYKLAQRYLSQLDSCL